MTFDDLDLPGSSIPLFSKTGDLDRQEGDYVNFLKSNNTEPIAEPLIEVPDDLKRNLAVTSLDALVNWGRNGGTLRS